MANMFALILVIATLVTGLFGALIILFLRQIVGKNRRQRSRHW